MSEPPPSTWRKAWHGPRRILARLLLLGSATFFIILFFRLMWGPAVSPSEHCAFAAIAAAGIFATGFLGTRVIHWRWLWSWRNLRRFLVFCASVATFIALFYAVEDWRGWHAWQKFEREWEAKGERFDLASLMPTPVPDDQNFALTAIVAGSYSSLLDKNGHVLRPHNTNAVDRMKMTICYHDDLPPTNGIGNWQKSTVSDLKAWQHYYRSLAARTNVLPKTPEMQPPAPAMQPPTPDAAYYRSTAAPTNVFPVAPQPQSPALDVLLALSRYEPAIEELRQASRLPGSRFPLDYGAENPYGILQPHLAAMKGCAQVLQLRALAELQNEQSDKALADVKLLLHLADSIRTEPLLISHLVRIAVVKVTLQPIWEGLAEHKWSGAQLVELDKALAKLDFLADYKFAMRGEMACQCGLLNYLREHPARISDVGDVSMSEGEQIIGYLFPSGWFYQNQLRCCRMMVQQYLPAADLDQEIMSPVSIKDADAALEAVATHPGPYNIFARMLLPALSHCAKRFAGGQSSVDLARVACALERYRPAGGEYPESLNAVAPQYVSELPRDIIGGQPLKYRRTEDGQFVLYSVGWNETDDGGEVVLMNSGQTVDITKGDWVWRYPGK